MNLSLFRKYIFYFKYQQLKYSGFKYYFNFILIMYILTIEH